MLINGGLYYIDIKGIVSRLYCVVLCIFVILCCVGVLFYINIGMCYIFRFWLYESFVDFSCIDVGWEYLVVSFSCKFICSW